jgi:hypothetical protein
MVTFLGLCPFDDAQASSESTTFDYSPVIGKGSLQRGPEAADEGASLGLDAARERASFYPLRVGERSASARLEPSLEQSLR